LWSSYLITSSYSSLTRDREAWKCGELGTLPT
jgi:hypothetical protein